MDVKEFFEKYSLKEISEKTKISPISLEYIKNKEFDKLPKVKFLGFLRLIENEFDVNLDELRKEYNNYHSQEKDEVKGILDEKPKQNNSFIIFLALILIGGGLYFYLSKNTKQIHVSKSNDQNKSENIQQPTIQNETNNTQNQIKNSNKTTIVKKKDNNTTKTKPVQKVIKDKVLIIPHEKLWFRAINLDNNKTFEYLTTKQKELKGENFYIKLGHGNVTIEYNDLNITPNTKKVVRILLKDGNFSYLPRKNRFEK